MSESPKPRTKSFSCAILVLMGIILSACGAPATPTATPTWTAISISTGHPMPVGTDTFPAVGATTTPQPVSPSSPTVTARILTDTPLPPETLIALWATLTALPTNTPPLGEATSTPNPTQALNSAFNEVDRQFQEVLSANIVYNVPESMKREETITIELLLNPSMSQAQLATQLVERSSFLTSTAEAGKLVTKAGGNIEVITSAVEITDRMKAVLQSQKPGAFEIQELHDSADQPISATDTTKWRWSVTAKEEGEHTLELVLNRLVKYEGKEYWVEVQSYRADIKVRVTAMQWLESQDWKWLLGILLTALLIPLFFRWVDSRRKEAGEPVKSKPSGKKPRRK